MKCEKFTDDRRRTTDDGRQVMAIVHMDLWSRWTKNRLWTKSLKIITYLYFKKWYECPISYISTVEWPICIGVFSQFQLYTCTYQNYIEEPNPRETSERMNFNVINQKQLIWKLFIYWNLMSLFHKKKCHKLFGPPLCHLDQWLNFLLAPKKKFRASQRPHFRHWPYNTGQFSMLWPYNTGQFSMLWPYNTGQKCFSYWWPEVCGFFFLYVGYIRIWQWTFHIFFLSFLGWQLTFWLFFFIENEKVDDSQYF